MEKNKRKGEKPRQRSRQQNWGGKNRHGNSRLEKKERERSAGSKRRISRKDRKIGKRTIKCGGEGKSLQGRKSKGDWGKGAPRRMDSTKVQTKKIEPKCRNADKKEAKPEKKRGNIHGVGGERL